MEATSREEFEAWQQTQVANVDAWSVWKASREAITIKLPPIDVWAQIGDRVACSRNETIEECRIVIESKGLKIIS
ncbi:hypothetical protein [Pseudomonas corrugata]